MSGEDETYYEIFAAQEYGFGGNNSVVLRVTEETETSIVGEEMSRIGDGGTGREMTVVKDNVQGWREVARHV